VVAQVLADRERREPEDVEVVVRGQAAVLQLPRVTALKAAVDQDPGAIHLLVEVVGHLLALGANPVQSKILDQRYLIGCI
jgi:hypothetical protein